MQAKDWLTNLRDSAVKSAVPVLSFPCVSLMGITVNDLIRSSELQSEGMALVAARVPSAASVSMMDLSVEAEAFGSAIRFDEKEVPAVTNILVHNEEEAKALRVPAVGAGRTGTYVEAIRLSVRKITDRPVFAGIIGPFSLAGRLVGVSEAMLYCYDEPDMMQIVLDKTAEFLTNYALAYKQTGAAGIVMAEPLAGLLSPAQAKAFSHPYVKRIIDAVQDENFIVIYHNCGESAAKMVADLVSFGASAYHFGNKVDLLEVLRQMPSNIVTLGNVDPAGAFKNGTPESVAEETKNLLERCAAYPNFVISSGCDIPPAAPWENIDAFFRAVGEFYQK